MINEEVKAKNKVWVVTTGTYSDKSIHSIWSTEELAKEAYKRIKEDDDGETVYIKDYVVDTYIDELTNKLPTWQVFIQKDGEVLDIYKRNFGDSPYYTTDFNVIDKDYAWAICFCRAESREHAIKIANERRIGWLATNT